MDGLPVTEQTDVPFRSRVTTTFRNETVGVMHACGHDVHTSVLMGVAEALTRVRAELPGTVVFLFQPAEEGAPEGEEGGASLMVREGVLERYGPEAVFGLHVFANMPVGMIGYRGGPLMAASDSYRIVVNTAEASGATATFEVNPGSNPVVRNDPDLTRRVVPTLTRVAGEGNVRTVPLVTGAEDFAYYAEKVPSFFYFVGITPRGQNPLTVASNHSPLFYVDEAGIPVAARSLAHIAVDYLQQGAAAAGR